VQPEKPAPGLTTLDLVMSRAEFERRCGADVDSGHDLLVGNGGVGSTATRRGAGYGAQGQGPGMARRDRVGAVGDVAPHSGRCGVARRGMGTPP
jgi:hypothetical protein